MSRRLFLALIVSALLSGNMSGAADPSQPTALNGFHRSGQTFITWAERADLSGEQQPCSGHALPQCVRSGLLQ